MSAVLKGATVVRSGRSILADANVECVRGEFTAFCGPNGAGKTTALSVLGGILRPTNGDALLDGRSVAHISAADLARVRAVVAQSGRLGFPFHVHEVVTMGRTPFHGLTTAADDARAVMAAMQALEIEHLGARNYLTLSGGERRRVDIARALAQAAPAAGRDPGWLFLDEPTAALDLKYQILLMRLLKRLAGEGWGIVAVLHDLLLVQDYADRAVMFAEGRVTASDSPNEVLTPTGIQHVFGLDAPYRIATAG
ncbi:MAG: ATP-binding cassette domain-containing protein [Pseudomonadota bacterium]